jgi:predicted nucleic acid-binding protein
MFLFDTSVWIQYLRNKEKLSLNSEYSTLFLKPLQNLQIATCGVILFELKQGARRSEHKENISDIENTTHYIDLTKADYKRAGEISKMLLLKNKKCSMPDLLIATCAINNNLTLISSDNHFQTIAEEEPKLKWKVL